MKINFQKDRENRLTNCRLKQSMSRSNESSSERQVNTKSPKQKTKIRKNTRKLKNKNIKLYYNSHKTKSAL